MKKLFNSENVRSFVFGVEDSLVSTVGLVSGIAVTNVSRSGIIITGLILIFVEAFSMGVGELLTSNAVEEYEERSNVSLTRTVFSAWVMFISYFLTGFIVLAPYFFFASSAALIWSVAFSLAALFCLGIISATLSNTHRVRKGFIMMTIGGGAILLGVFIGNVLQQFLQF